MSLGSTLIYLFVRKNIKTNIESELNNTTNAIMNLVQTSVAVSIKNHLRAVSEKNLELVHHYYRQYQTGSLTLQQAQEGAATIMLSQSIGESGYIYCIDSAGVVRVHPQSELMNTNVSEFAFVREQLRLKKGYIEYDWKNPGEARMRPKALYMHYFEPWDWIISVSAYRQEFRHLVDVSDFRKAVLDIHSGPGGYSFVIDKTGSAIIHPKLQGVNIFNAEDLPNHYLEEMRRRKSGKITYSRKNPGEHSERLKLVIFNHIPVFDWIVGSSSYLDEFYQPLTTLRNLVLVIVLATLVLVLPITFKISASITNPLRKLMHQLKQVGNGNLIYPTKMQVGDEIGQLTDYFNRFIDQLETYHTDLTKEIDVRRKAEEDLRESEARYRSVMEAAPDPIVVYDMQGQVTFLNPAFTRLFGWTLEECKGKKMDHFVPAENWDETHQMIKAALAGETFTAVPTNRYDKAGNILHVSISGSIYRNYKGNLAGSVIILRDITKSTRLRRQLMNIGDRERQKIGQDLHDDLCPHLIGIHGMSSVLQANLDEASSPDMSLASQIVDLVGEAVEKTRGLTRGLCPVHMVSHGLETALKDLADHTTRVSSITCEFTCDGIVNCTDNTKATHLYYIAREAVNNSVRHSGASRIVITLSGKDDVIELLIDDDGKGMPDHMPSEGIGLQIMTYRAKMIGANLNIESTPRKGTRIHARIKKDLPAGAD
jgi:PAS domain S-box-containing protein